MKQEESEEEAEKSKFCHLNSDVLKTRAVNRFSAYELVLNGHWHWQIRDNEEVSNTQKLRTREAKKI